jgi:phage repressor protein C with HTH and peptisase S24 domain
MMGVAIATYIAHENGHRGLSVQAAEKYAKAFNVRAAWLLTGEEPENYAHDISRSNGSDDVQAAGDDLDKSSPNSSRDIQELSPWSDERQLFGNDVIAEWGIPPAFVRQTLQASPSSIFIVNAVDDSLAPTFLSGDRAIIDASQKTYRGEGIYALQDQDGNMLLRVLTKVIVNPSKEGNIGVSTTKPGETYFTTLASLNIRGRAVGKIGKI